MAILRFDSCEIDGTTITDAEFVSGSGRINYVGDDAMVTTADGRQHNTRRARNYRAEFQMYGDGADMATTAPGLGKTVKFYRGSATTAIATFTAVTSCQFNSSDNVSSMSVVGDPN
jgi:hypothetical protein